MRWFLQRVELLRERNRLEAIVRAQSYEIERLRAELAAWTTPPPRSPSYEYVCKREDMAG